MTNSNIQGPVPIIGRGQVYRPNGNFAPGEFKTLHNAEITEGKIIQRRNIHTAVVETAYYDSNPGILFKGKVDDKMPYYTGGDSYHKVLQNLDPPWNSFVGTAVKGMPAALNIPPGGIFNYNNLNYRVTTKTDSGIGLVTNMDIWTEGTIPDPSAYIDFNSTSVQVLSFPFTSYRTIDLARTVCTNVICFRDRAWISWSHGVYFSKAGDPKLFNTEDGGGFFLFPDDIVRYTIAIKDTVYVICDSRIYSISYNSDPNTDAVRRVISSDVGGFHGCIFRDTPYVVNAEGIFAIQNSYVEKVLDSKDYGFSSFSSNKCELTPFGPYIILNKYLESFTSDAQFKYNLARAGYIKATTDITDYMNYGTCTLSLDAAAGSVGLPGATSTYAIKALNSVAAATAFSWAAKASVGSDRYMDVQPGDVYSIKFYIKTNSVNPITVYTNLSVLDAAGSVITTVSISTGAAQTVQASQGWVQVGGPLRIDQPDARYAYPTWSVSKASGFSTSEYIQMQHLVIEPNTDGSTQFSQDTIPTYKQWYYNSNGYGTQDIIFVGDADKNYITQRHFFDPAYSGTGQHDYQTWFFNMDEGSSHTVSFDDGTDQFVTDMITEYDDDIGCPVLYMATLSGAQASSSNPGKHIRYMALNRFADVSVYDDVTGPLTYTHPMIKIRMDGFSPDGPNYMMKRFRSLEIQGVFPADNVLISASVDRDVSEIITDEPISDYSLSSSFNPFNKYYHYPHRLGINARGRVLNFYIFTSSNVVTVAEEPPQAPMWGPFEISDMRVLYQLTQRGPHHQNSPQTP